MNDVVSVNLINGLLGQPMPFPTGKQAGLRSHLSNTFKVSFFNQIL